MKRVVSDRYSLTPRASKMTLYFAVATRASLIVLPMLPVPPAIAIVVDMMFEDETTCGVVQSAIFE